MVSLRPWLRAVNGQGLRLGSEVILTWCYLPWKKIQPGSVHCANSPQMHTYTQSPSHEEPSLAFLEAVDLLIKRWLGRRSWAYSCLSITALRFSGYFLKNWGSGGVRT